MKFTAAIILPAVAMANPLLSVRQEERAKFTGQFRTEGAGCPNGSVNVTFSGSGEFVNEFAEVNLPTYNVQVGPNIPDSQREKECSIFLTVHYPIGCTQVSYDSTLTGPVRLDPGVTGVFSRAYTQDHLTLTSGQPAELRFDSSSGPDFIQEDHPAGRVNINTPNQQNADFTLRSRLSLQRPNNALSGTLTNDVYALSLTDQARCCK